MNTTKTTRYEAKYYTARQMAEMSHNLSKDGMSATMANGDVYKWTDHFNVWAGPFPRSSDDAKPPRATRRKKAA